MRLGRQGRNSHVEWEPGAGREMVPVRQGRRPRRDLLGWGERAGAEKESGSSWGRYRPLTKGSREDSEQEGSLASADWSEGRVGERRKLKVVPKTPLNLS